MGTITYYNDGGVGVAGGTKALWAFREPQGQAGREARGDNSGFLSSSSGGGTGLILGDLGNGNLTASGQSKTDMRATDGEFIPIIPATQAACVARVRYRFRIARPV